MASVSPSSSPRWDTRNSGFISPSQLQLLKQQEELAQRQHQQQIQQYHHHDEFPEQHELPTSAAAQAEAPQPGMFRTTSRQDAALAPAAPTHSRTTSAFSLFKSKASHSATPSTSSAPQAISEQGELRNGHGHQHTPSLNGKGPMSPATPLSPNREQPAPPGPANGPGTPTRASTSSAAAAAAPPLPPLHPEIRSIVQLTLAHSRKVYFSGPLIRRIERQPDGQRPTKDEGWRDVFAQLGGTTLSLWDMQEIEEASKQGRQVPPSYVNITDAVSTPRLFLGPMFKPASTRLQVRRGAWVRHYSCDTDYSSKEVHQRSDFEHRRLKSPALCMPVHPSAALMDRRCPARSLGEVASRGDL